MERYLRVNLLGPGRPLTKKNNLPGRGPTEVKKHCYIPPINSTQIHFRIILTATIRRVTNAGYK
jgi:hypothetical protein